jgi:uncharacterized protein involved in cysteine biosynthesis
LDAFAGIGLILKNPRLWPLCLAPVLFALLAYFSLGYFLFDAFGGELKQWLGQWVFLAQFTVIVFWAVLFPYVFLILGSGFLALVFEPLAREIEKALGDAPPQASLRLGPIVLDTLARLALNGFLALLGFGLGLILGPIPGICVAALIGLLDYTAVAFLRRGIGLKAQWGILLKKPDVHTLLFAVISGLLSLVPIVGLLLAPGLIAGGVKLARRRLTISPRLLQ